MKLEFRSTETMVEYRSKLINCVDGEVVEVEEKTASYLLTNFPKNFSKIDKAKEEKVKEEKKEETKIVKGKEDKKK